MAEPVKMVMDDGSQLTMIRCPICKCPRVVDYICPGCEAKKYRETANEIRQKMDDLKMTLITCGL